MDSYTEAHLFVAAVRVLRHKTRGAPTLEDICQLLGFSVEHGHSLCRKLKKHHIVDNMEDAFSVRVSVRDHLAIEQLSKEPEAEDTLSRELEQFMGKKKDMDKKVESIQAELAAKKKNMFADIDAKLKQQFSEQDPKNKQ